MRIPIFCAVLLLVASTAVRAQEYDIVFHRDSKAGEKNVLQFKVTNDEDQQFSVNGKALPTNTKMKVQVELTVLSEDVVVDSNGDTTEARLIVQSCQCTKDGAVTPLFKAQDEIHLKEGEPKLYLVNNNPALGLQRALLVDLFPAKGKESNTDDKVFGPGRKVKLSESWPINSEFALADLSKKMGVEVPQDAMKGSVKLESANPKNGIPCLQISGSLQISTSGLPLPGAPPQIKAKKFEMGLKVSGDFPLDLKMHRLAETMEMTSNAEGGGTIEKDGQTSEVTFHITRSQKKEASISPAP